MMSLSAVRMECLNNLCLLFLIYFDAQMSLNHYVAQVGKPWGQVPRPPVRPVLKTAA